MRGKSHICLGEYLADSYMPEIKQKYRKAFMLGCIQPDRNPATYLKGSIRSQWLRGHNFENANRFIARIARRLERKEHWNLWDYYTAGKLIHYTADAFTYAHNSVFPKDLQLHRQYESQLQEYFLNFLMGADSPKESSPFPPEDIILRSHSRYLRGPLNIEQDSRFIFQVCCAVTSTLTAL